MKWATKRIALRFSMSLALAQCIIWSATATRPIQAQDKPNIVILYADDLGFGDIRANNPKSKIPTPNLNQLLADGLRFTDGHSSSGICTPSRYALLTGRHHWRDFHGIVGVFGKSVFDPQRLTLPEMLRERDYTTACIGKWHLGWNWDEIRRSGVKPEKDQRGRSVWPPNAFDWTKPIPDGPLTHGFDYYFGDTVINFPPYTWIENEHVVTAPDVMMDTALWKPIKEGNWECRPGPMAEGWDPYQVIPTLTKKAEQFLKRQQGEEKPFFLYFAFPSPHAPIIPNDEFDGRSQAGPYGDFVYETDAAAGRILETLDQIGASENTIVIFTADNGPEKYAYARDQRYGHWSAEPFRGLKRDIYEGGHHVPFGVRWPGKIEPGRVSDALVSQIDIIATLADVIEYSLPVEAAEDSHSLLNLWLGKSESVRTTHVHNTYQDRYAIRHHQWLLVDGKDGYHSGRNKVWEQEHGYTGDDDAPFELYALESDPGQKTNIARQHPQVVEQLQSLLAQIKESPTAPRLSQD